MHYYSTTKLAVMHKGSYLTMSADHPRLTPEGTPTRPSRHANQPFVLTTKLEDCVSSAQMPGGSGPRPPKRYKMTRHELPSSNLADN